jgi:hypothetical protein
LLTGSCTGSSDTILEAKDVQFFKVEIVRSATPVRLKISGLAFYSALSVRKITTRTNGHNMVVLVHLGLAKKGESGSFEYELTVPDDVMEVGFGNGAVTIWKREPKGSSAM